MIKTVAELIHMAAVKACINCVYIFIILCAKHEIFLHALRAVVMDIKPHCRLYTSKLTWACGCHCSSLRLHQATGRTQKRNWDQGISPFLPLPRLNGTSMDWPECPNTGTLNSRCEKVAQKT